MTEELEPGFEMLAQPPERSHRIRGKLLVSIAAVVVLGAGAAVSYAEFASSGGGASSPNKAVQNVVTDLDNSDLLGLVSDLAPGERAALSGAINTDVTALKRLGVLAANADPNSVSGVHFTADNLSYGNPITVNDHVQIVQITGGSIDVSGDVSKLPFSQRFLATTHPPSGEHTQRVPINHPVRIATEKVDGGWYASLFYTIADQAAHHAIPDASDAVPATGADSPQDAVDKLLRSALSGDLRSVIGIVSPDELGALHDYGGMLLKNHASPHPLPVTVKNISYNTTPITDGVRVSLASLSATFRGISVNVTMNQGCATVDAGPFHRTVCPSDATNLIGGYLGGQMCKGWASYTPMGKATSAYRSTLHIRVHRVNVNGKITTNGLKMGEKSLPSQLKYGAAPINFCHGPSFTAAQKQAITDLVKGLTSTAGVDTAQVGGKWYVTPVRTFADLGANILQALHGDDLYQLAKAVLMPR